MKQIDLSNLFILELRDIYGAELQILEALPRLIKLASLPDLKLALAKHLKETKQQVDRLKKIFSLLKLKPIHKKCEGIEGIIHESQQLLKQIPKSPTLDAAIISSAQKVEHYEITSYGTLRSLAEQLGLSLEVIDLLQDTLDEEGAADKKLTKIAQGSLFSPGINQEAAEQVITVGKKNNKH